MADVRLTPVPAEKLRASFDPAVLTFECTDELRPLTDFVGQDRATNALAFGLGLRRPGYNVFVTGMTGTGKATAILEYIRRQVEEGARRGEEHKLQDWLYVYNFEEPDKPNAIAVPAGTGRQLRDSLEGVLDLIRATIARIFTSEEYERQRRAVLEQGQQKAQEVMEAAQRQAADAGFALTFLPTGPALIPLKDGRPMTPDEYAALSSEEQRQISERERSVTQLVPEVAERLRAIEREVAGGVQTLDREVVAAIVNGPFDSLDRDYAAYPEVATFLTRLREFTLKSADYLRHAAAQPGAFPQDGLASAGAPDPFTAFRVNLFVDNSETSGPPIIIEANPTWTNLFGRIDRRAFMGTYLSDHTMLKPGAAHRANGGYLILNFTDVATRPGAWDGLKRMIRTSEVRLEDPMEQYGLLSPQTLRPEPVPVDVKLLVTGDTLVYILLSAYDEEFWELFKVKADFDYQIPRTADNVNAYAGFICAICEREGLRHFERSAVAKLVEHGSRAVEDQEKLSARFGRLRDIIVEADHWAAQEGARRISGQHVERAIDEKIYRSNLIEERVREMISRGTIIIDTAGAAPGQVNGLAILDIGDLRFGRPMRITARAYLGQRGVVSIDRESQLSGKVHDKGVLTLSGYLGWKYGQDRPLSLSVSITFEQGYDPIEGDSASLGETCAILSALAGAPVRQDIAITGSVNQMGEVQPIGGVNHKIEGFFDVCKAIGLTGEQGVVIPTRNLKNLMLRKDVVQAVEEGQFRVYAVGSVDEALEALTGLPAGERDAEGKYPEGSVHYLVHRKLDEMAEAMRRQAPQQVRVESRTEAKEEAPQPPHPPEPPPDGPPKEPGIPA